MRKLLLTSVAALSLTAPAFAQQPGSGAQAPVPGGQQQVNGHVVAYGSPPTLSSCGTGATISGNDSSGIVVPQQTTCTITFALAYKARPICNVTGETVLASYTTTPTTISITSTVAGIPIHYDCIGQPGG